MTARRTTHVHVAYAAALAALASAFAMPPAFAAETAPAPALPSVGTVAAWHVGKAPASRSLFVSGNDTASFTVVATDLGTDGIDEIVTGSAFGMAPLVRIVRQDGSVITSFAPFADDMRQGVQVAAGDLDGDGMAEIVAATGPGVPTHVRVFTVGGREMMLPGGYYPFGRDFDGGASIATGDLDGDGKDEILLASGATAEPRIKVLRGDGALLADFAAFDPELHGGVHVTTGDLDGDGSEEIIAAMAGDAVGEVRVFDGSGTLLRSFVAINHDFRGGLNLTSRDLDGDGRAEIAVAPNGGGGPHVHVFGGEGALQSHFFAYDEAFRGGVLLTAAKFSKDAPPELLTMTVAHDRDGRPQLPKYINVDISDQRMRIYEYGRLVKTMLVATGLPGYPTPRGEHKVIDNPLYVRYARTYGPGDPNNYDYGFVKWNLRIIPSYYIHNAPWRKVFGTPGSHGCINVNGTDAEWIYNWAEIGTPVTVQD